MWTQRRRQRHCHRHRFSSPSHDAAFFFLAASPRLFAFVIALANIAPHHPAIHAQSASRFACERKRASQESALCCCACAHKSNRPPRTNTHRIRGHNTSFTRQDARQKVATRATIRRATRRCGFFSSSFTFDRTPHFCDDCERRDETMTTCVCGMIVLNIT